MQTKTKLLLLLIVLLAIQAKGQVSSTDVPTGSKTGLPEGGSFEGTQENVNLVNGNVHVSLPLLNLPGVAGFGLNLSLLIDSRVVSMNGGRVPQENSAGMSYDPPTLQANQMLGGIPFAGGRISLPSLKWGSANMSFYISGGMGGPTYGSVACPSGFTFTDSTGAMHGFKNFPPCQFISPVYTINVDDATDGSLSRLDTTNTHDMVVTDRSGIQYHFDISSDTGYIPFQINDPNGNKMTTSTSGSYADRTITITDSQNRKVTIAPGDISYRDSAGDVKHIIATQYLDTPTTISTSAWSCHSRDGGYNLYRDATQYTGGNLRWTVQLPTQDIYQLSFNGMSELTKIIYPSGGYTRYDYQEEQSGLQDDSWTCQYPQRQIIKRSVCANSSGNCSQEAVTSYTPTVLVQGGVAYDSNSSVDVADPFGNHTVHSFTQAAADTWFMTAPVESDVTYNDGTSTKLMTVHTDYVLPASVCATSPQPTKVTTTIFDGSNSISSYVTLEHQTVLLKLNKAPTSQCTATSTSMTDNLTNLREYGFDGTLLRATTQTWSSGSPDGNHILDRLTSRNQSNGNFTSNHSWVFDGLGNLTSEVIGGSETNDATTVYGRDSYGRMTSIQDPRGKTTNYYYTPSWSTSDCSPAFSAFATEIKNPLSQSTKLTYNPCTGTVSSKLDANSQATTFAYDSIGRTTAINYPDGGGSRVQYSSEPGTPQTTTVFMDYRGVSTEEDHDGLGRTTQKRNTSTSEGTTYVDTNYDARGQVAAVSNPYVGIKTGSTTFTYDALGRRRLQCNPDNGTASGCAAGTSYRETSYSLNTSTDYDELRHATKRQTDALGRLTDVWEPDSSGTPNLHTEYSYDAVGDLLTVNQKGVVGDTARSRSFHYNGRGELMYASNPESGLICYGQGDGSQTGCQNNGYDLNGNLAYKTDARGRVTSYSYDDLNRLTSTTFSDSTGSTCFSYDSASWTPSNAIGRLTAKWTKKGACDSSVPSLGLLTKTTVLSYDPMGRVKSQTVCVLSRCSSPRIQNYNYDLAGNETSFLDGRGTLTFEKTYDPAGRLQEIDAVISGQSSALYKIRAYGPGGWMDALQGTGIRLCKGYDSRMRPTDMTASATDATCQ